jgi:hypothetical protein
MTAPVTALSPTPRQLFLNPSTGAPYSGAKVFSYQAGTTTKLATYTDSTGATANTNPIILDSLGEADIWLTPVTGYKFVFSPPTDTDPPTNPIWTRDNIIAGIPGTSTEGGGGPSLCPNSLLVTTALECTVDGGGSVPSTGICGDLYVPFACTITSNVLQAVNTGSVELDIWAAPFVAGTPPIVGNSIVASDYPTISDSNSSEDTSLTGWTLAIAAGTWLRFNINSISTITRFTLTLVCTGTVNFS